MKHNKIIFSIMVLLFSVFFIACIHTSKEEIINEINTGNYKQALEDIHGLNVNEQQEVEQFALSKVGVIVDAVKNNKMTYSQAIEELKFIEQIVPNTSEDEVDKAIQEVKNMENKANRTF
ncbi:MAG: hypothetical protein ACRDDL_03750 [Sarcina sp.]